MLYILLRSKFRFANVVLEICWFTTMGLELSLVKTTIEFWILQQGSFGATIHCNSNGFLVAMYKNMIRIRLARHGTCPISCHYNSRIIVGRRIVSLCECPANEQEQRQCCLFYKGFVEIHP